ncbi:MAG TPA: hypothetical protein VHE83_08965 [Mycobacteriales bacterium]|nr:hypothetical protein [Mycobacteriales bacterium]
MSLTVQADERARELAGLAARVRRVDERLAPSLAAAADEPLIWDRLVTLPPLAVGVFLRHLPDLEDVPRFRRAGAVEAALHAAEALTANGPCSYCGAVIARRGRSITAAYAEPPAFTTAQGKPACSWCSDSVELLGVDGLATTVVAAAAGCAVPMGLRVDPLRVWASQVPGAGDGTPWSHVDRRAARAFALATWGPGYARLAPPRVPGLEPITWPAPPPERAWKREPTLIEQLAQAERELAFINPTMLPPTLAGDRGLQERQEAAREHQQKYAAAQQRVHELRALAAAEERDRAAGVVAHDRISATSERAR